MYYALLQNGPSRRPSLPPRRRYLATRSRRPRPGLGFIGNDASVLEQVFAGQSGAPAAPLVRQTVQQAMDRNALWTKEDCSGIVGPSTASLVLSQGGGAAVSWATTALAAGASGPLAPIVLAVGGITQLFGSIFGHHAAKVRQERQIICAVVQSCNDAFSVIDQAVQQGAVSRQGAITSLDTVYSNLQQQVQSILKQDSGHCNAACFILAEARGVIGKMKEKYSVPPLRCAQAYWKHYPDVAHTPDFGVASGPLGAWNHYQRTGKNQGRIWPCDQNDQLIQAAPGSAGTSSGDLLSMVVTFVNNAAASFGVPAIVVWGAGAFLAFKLIRG